MVANLSQLFCRSPSRNKQTNKQCRFPVVLEYCGIYKTTTRIKPWRFEYTCMALQYRRITNFTDAVWVLRYRIYRVQFHWKQHSTLATSSTTRLQVIAHSKVTLHPYQYMLSSPHIRTVVLLPGNFRQSLRRLQHESIKHERKDRFTSLVT